MGRADGSLNYCYFLFPGLKPGATILIEPMALQKTAAFFCVKYLLGLKGRNIKAVGEAHGQKMTDEYKPCKGVITKEERPERGKI